MTAFGAFRLSSLVLGASLLTGGELGTYRGFQFGMNVSTAARQAGVQASDAKVVHARPAVIQELEWMPRTFPNARAAEPIRDGLLSFYNGELFRIVVNYERDRVAGMTPADMVAAISKTYGAATQPNVEVAFRSNYAEVAPVIARWEDSQYSYNLVRSGYGDSFAMVMYSQRVDALALGAIAEAARLDAKEAPARAIEAEKKLQQDERVALQKARSVNAPNFRP